MCRTKTVVAHTEIQIDRHIHIHTNIYVCMYVCMHTYRQADRQTDRDGQADRQTYIQTDTFAQTYRQTDIQTYTQTDRQTYAYMHACMHACMHTYIRMLLVCALSSSDRCCIGAHACIYVHIRASLPLRRDEPHRLASTTVVTAVSIAFFCCVHMQWRRSMAECELSPIVRRFRLPTVHPFVSPRVVSLPFGIGPDVS